MIAAIVERHGMAILSDIDVNASLKKRLGLDIAGYRIISACHPGLAGGALRPDGSARPVLHFKAVLNELDDGTVRIAVSGGLDSEAQDSGALSVANAAEALLREMFSEARMAVAA